MAASGEREVAAGATPGKESATIPLPHSRSLSPMPTVSVVMAVYNAAPYLAQAVRSVLDQTFERLELLAVDDGSTDHSLEILKGFAAADGRVRIVRGAHEGVAAARNTAVALARG